jgi:hypothetical protein
MGTRKRSGNGRRRFPFHHFNNLARFPFAPAPPYFSDFYLDDNGGMPDNVIVFASGRGRPLRIGILPPSSPGEKLLKAVPHRKPSPSPRLPLRSRYPPPMPAPFIRRDRKDSNRQEIPIPALWYDRIGKVPATPAAIGLGARGPASSLPPTSRNSDGKGGKWNRNGSPARAARRKPGMSGGSDRRPS